VAQSLPRLASIAVGLVMALSGPSARAQEPVDLLLVLAADVSRSVDEAKFQLQRQGYASAMTNPDVLSTISFGRHGRIAVCFVEWSGAASQRLLVDWTLIGGEADAADFSRKILDLPRSFADRTSISAGIDFSLGQFDRSPFVAERHVIDVSGDGTNNSGRDVTTARDEALAHGVTTINGLVILSAVPSPYNPEHTHPPGGLGDYYRNNVIGGQDAFVFVAEDFTSFGKAILAKLIREVSSRQVSGHPS
jgi:hypothetical protein